MYRLAGIQSYKKMPVIAVVLLGAIITWCGYLLYSSYDIFCVQRHD